ncbi:hypothetical protein [Rhodovibrio salinarum]|uniref:Uncharacterized protein n=1 Tax=Rhodovibrio salinarum TaxID=1087 RepID=A0A934QJL1_9PROT|nr:hypothetical protein [Rhodovibrio salinarum]MBK1697635.1 hypothetical protein [Rhodovibrio salinarum]
MQASDVMAIVLDKIPTVQAITAFTVGLLFIVLNLRTRFNDIAGEPFPEEFRSFKLSDLTSLRRFQHGLAIYFLLLALIYVLLLSLGPNVLNKLFGVTVSEDTFPLYLALALAGIVPNVQLLAHAEESVRGLAQRIAGVPSDHSYIRRKIAEAKIKKPVKDDLKAYLGAQLPLDEARQLISERELKDLLKCCLIVRALDQVTSEHPMVNHVTVRVSHTFDAKLQDGRRRVEAIAETLRTHLAQASDEAAAHAPSVRGEIRDAYDLLTYLLSCAIVAETSARQREVNVILDEMGFVVNRNIRRYVQDRVLSATLQGSVAVFVASAAVNVLFGLVAPARAGEVVPVIRWITYALSFAVPTYVMLAVYCWRRNHQLARRRWFMTASGYRPRMSKQVGAAGAAVVCTAVIAPFVDAAALIAETERIRSLAAHFPVDDASYWAYLLTYLITPFLILVFFAKLIERDRQAEFDAGFAVVYFAPRRVVTVSATYALTIAVFNVTLVLMTSESLHAWLLALRVGGLMHFFAQPQTVNVAWFLCAVGAGAFVFFRSFIRSGLDVSDPDQSSTPAHAGHPVTA